MTIAIAFNIRQLLTCAPQCIDEDIIAQRESDRQGLDEYNSFDGCDLCPPISRDLGNAASLGRTWPAAISSKQTLQPRFYR